MTKKMTTSNTNMPGASGEKAVVSDFNSSLPFQPVGNPAGALTLRTVFHSTKILYRYGRRLNNLRSCPPSFIPGHRPVSRNFWTSAAETGEYGFYMLPISNMCLILIHMLRSSHV